MLRLHALGRARPRSVFALARFHPTNCSSMQCKNHVSRSGFFSTSGAAPSQLPPPLADDTIFSNGHQELADASDPLESNRGTVLDVDGSFAFVEDMPFLPLGAVVVFERSGVHGLVMKISKEFIMIGVLGPTAAIVSGDIVSLLGSTLTFPTGPTLEGRVISPLGGSRDGGPSIHADASLQPIPILSAAPPAMRDWDHTVAGQKRIFSGLAAIDFFYPLARGHRMALAGPANCGKSTMALDIILHQRLHNEQNLKAPGPPNTALADSPSNLPLHCIYVSIGKTKAAVQDSVSLLQSHGALAYTTVVAALDKDPIMLQYLAPYVGTAIAEYYRDRGQHALVVFDDLTQHAIAYASLSKQLYEIPINLRFMHGSLLERAGILNDARGGGSLAMICLSRLDNIAQGLATSVESTLVLDEVMSQNGQWPAVNCSSVSHLPSPKFFVGASRQLAVLYKKYLGESREVSLHADLTRQFGLPLEDEARATIEYRNKLVAFLLQRESLFWEEQCLLMYAALRSDLEELDIDLIPQYTTRLVEFARERFPHVLQLLADLPPDQNLDRASLGAMDELVLEFEASFEELRK